MSFHDFDYLGPRAMNCDTAPLEEITPHVLRFWKARLTDKAIVEELRKVIDTDRYGIG